MSQPITTAPVRLSLGISIGGASLSIPFPAPAQGLPTVPVAPPPTVAWGQLTGTLSSQIDLWAVLNTHSTGIQTAATSAANAQQAASNAQQTATTAVQAAIGAQQTADGALADLATKSPIGHTHAQADVVGLDTALASINTALATANAALQAKVATALLGVANGVATLGPDGTVPIGQIGALALVNTYVRASEADMLAIAGVGQGDVCVRTDAQRTFILGAPNGAVLTNWQELLTPWGSDIAAIAGQVGALQTALANVQTALAGKADSTAVSTLLLGKANTLHTHSIADVVSLQGALDAKASTGDLATAMATKANVLHVHAPEDVTGLSAILATLTAAQTALSATITTGLVGKLDANLLGASNGVAQLDANGKLLTSMLPALAVNEQFSAATESVMLALAAQPGDTCYRTDLVQTFLLVGSDPAALRNWVGLLTGTSAVTRVNGMVGNVSLGTADIAESGAALYYTDARAQAALAASLATKANATATTNALAGKSDIGHMHVLADVSGLQTALSGKADATTTTNALAGKADASATTTALSVKAALAHTHVIAEVTGLQALLDGKLNWRGAWAALTSYAVNDVVTFGGCLWRRTTAGTSGSTFAVSAWDALTRSGTLYCNNAPATTSGTGQQVLRTVAIPAGLLSADKCLRITPLWECNNANINVKYARVALDAGSYNTGTSPVVRLLALNTAAIKQQQDYIQLRYRSTTQLVMFPNAIQAPIGTTNQAATVLTVPDAGSAFNVHFVGECQNAADTLTLHSCLVELL